MNAWCVTAATASCCQQLERTQDAQDRQKQEQKAKQNKPTKKGKIQFASCGCGFYLYFFSHKFTFVVFCSGLGICTLVQGLDTYAPAPFIASPPSNLLLPLYTFHSHCLFMSFCLCCLHSANCAIFKRRVLVFSTEFWTKPMCVCVCGWWWEGVSSAVVVSTPNRRCSSTKFVLRLTKLNSTLTTQRRSQYATSVSTQRSYCLLATHSVFA